MNLLYKQMNGTSYIVKYMIIVVLYLDCMLSYFKSTHGPNLAYCAIFLNKLVKLVKKM